MPVDKFGRMLVAKTRDDTGVSLTSSIYSKKWCHSRFRFYRHER